MVVDGLPAEAGSKLRTLVLLDGDGGDLPERPHGEGPQEMGIQRASLRVLVGGLRPSTVYWYRFVDALLEIVVTTWVRVHGALQYPVATRFTLAD